MSCNNTARTLEETFPPKGIHAICLALDIPIISATAWNDAKYEKDFITDKDYRTEPYDFNVIKDLNRIFLADIIEILDGVSKLAEEFILTYTHKPSGRKRANKISTHAEFALLIYKVSDLIKLRFPSQDEVDSLQRIVKRLIVSSLIANIWTPLNDSKSEKPLNCTDFDAWKSQMNYIDTVFTVLIKKIESGSSFEVLSDSFRMMVGIEPYMFHSDFERELAEYGDHPTGKIQPSPSRTKGKDDSTSSRPYASKSNELKSDKESVLDPQPCWDDIEALSVHDAAPIYGNLWAAFLQLNELEYSKACLKEGTSVSYEFVRLLNSDASFKSFELSRHGVSSPHTDYGILQSIAEICINTAKKSKKYYGDGKYRSAVQRLERSLNAVKIFHRHFHLEVAGEETMIEDGHYSAPYFSGYGTTKTILQNISIEEKIELVESYRDWSKFTSDVRIDTLPLFYACMLDTALRSGIVPKRCKHCGGMFFPENPNQQYCHRVSKATGIRCDNAELRRKAPGEKPYFNNVCQNIKKKALRAASKDWRVADYYTKLACFVHDSAGPLYRSSDKVGIDAYQQWLKEALGPKFGTVSGMSLDQRPFPVIWEGKVIEGNQPLYVRKDTKGYLFLADLQEFWDSNAAIPSSVSETGFSLSGNTAQITWNNDYAVLPIYRFIELLLDPEAQRILGSEQVARIPVPGLTECDDYLLGKEIEKHLE